VRTTPCGVKISPARAAPSVAVRLKENGIRGSYRTPALKSRLADRAAAERRRAGYDLVAKQPVSPLTSWDRR
jgi:hypothetical protein